MIYLDHAATTPVPRAVADAMYEVLTEQFGNPSSQYPMGLEMKRRVEVWRKTVADALGCGAKQLFFTSCGTEADNWAVTAACWQNRHLGRHIVTTAVEHSAVLEACRWMERQGYEVTYLVPAQDGSLSAEQVLAAVRQDTALVSCMLVNNELGNIYPIAEIARGLAVKNPQTLLHTDAVQGFLKVPCSAKTLGADFLTISAHKIGGPKGIGALYIGPRVRNPKPLLAPGGAPHILSISLVGWPSQNIVNDLGSQGVCISAGSACHQGKPSHVIAALKLSKKVSGGVIRLSFGPETDKGDIDACADALRRHHDTRMPML